MHCYLNIGNTHAQILTCCDGRETVQTVATDDFSPEMIPSGSKVAAACVVERLFPVLTGLGARFAAPEAASDFVDFSAVDASTLGQDRVANAVYLAAKAALPAVALDFGTCITAEVVDAKRRFLGGAIFPGRSLMRRALNLYTSTLPLVELASGLPPCPGANTADAIRTGTDAAAVDAVAGFLARLEKVLGCRPAVYAGGGDEAFFSSQPELSGMIRTGNGLTLAGLRIMFPASAPRRD